MPESLTRLVHLPQNRHERNAADRRQATLRALATVIKEVPTSKMVAGSGVALSGLSG